ncbi:ECF RNA polymerase sigma factor SigK [Ornithinimicrobium tianjinense]|uniref:RNA polymerase sigma factor n=1 Tax=Ornithinimicrobium tianjinense TaxID=1195761 RepID=A0A917BLE6_9MICO|nr:ECF RNA polymerase sigma factor SigK [Ornithinimicrobium tianjinense]GGF45347.1 RNA polymerase sigma factor SigK [Ornithinimicrobium tianjinense]
MGPAQGAGPLLSPTDSNVELSLLLRRVAAQDQSAFADLYDQVSPRIYGLALRVLRNPSMAEEVTQEVLLQVWREARTFDPARGSALAWLMTIAHRRAVDRVRSEEAQSARLHRYEARQEAVPYDSTAEEGEMRIEASRVRRAIDAVGEPHRTTLLLAYFEGLTHREVAERTQVPLGTAKTRIRDGLLKMRTAMAPGGEQ